jgi:alkylation response protein AidB-like acyl-CoA dehydrogenase
MGTNMIGPTILEHGSEHARETLLRGIYSGDTICCQLFSEPDAGSDLAGLRTSARPDGSGNGQDWIITGQKVWTSHAHYADLAEIICRTDPDAPKHRGLSAFIIDMRDPGVEVRPLRQMTGGASFNEVFLDGVRVSDSYRLGPVHGGWAVALHTLASERTSIGAAGGRVGVNLEMLEQMLAHLDVLDDPVIRDRYAKLHANTLSARWLGRRIAGGAVGSTSGTGGRAGSGGTAGVDPGGFPALSKLALTRDLQLCSDLVTDALAERLVADSGEWGTYAWGDFVLGVPGLRIAGGTDEVLRNIVAERSLGLPKGT